MQDYCCHYLSVCYLLCSSNLILLRQAHSRHKGRLASLTRLSVDSQEEIPKMHRRLRKNSILAETIILLPLIGACKTPAAPSNLCSAERLWEGSEWEKYSACELIKCSDRLHHIDRPHWQTPSPATPPPATRPHVYILDLGLIPPHIQHTADKSTRRNICNIYIYKLYKTNWKQ